MTRLCPECETKGTCWFKENADKIAANVSNRRNFDLIMGLAIEAHRDISEARVVAREKMCPNLNQIDPDYPGKNLL